MLVLSLFVNIVLIYAYWGVKRELTACENDCINCGCYKGRGGSDLDPKPKEDNMQ